MIFSIVVRDKDENGDLPENHLEALGNKLTSELLFWLALDVFHRARVVMLFWREPFSRNRSKITRKHAGHEHRAYTGKASGSCSYSPLRHCFFGQVLGWDSSRTST